MLRQENKDAFKAAVLECRQDAFALGPVGCVDKVLETLLKGPPAYVRPLDRAGFVVAMRSDYENIVANRKEAETLIAALLGLM